MYTRLIRSVMRLTTLLLYILITSQARRTLLNDVNTLRIIAGADAEVSDDTTALKYPFVVRIDFLVRKWKENKYKNYYATRCTGSALTPLWTLTAAHCALAPTYNYQVVVRFGSKTFREKHVKFATIHDFVIHTSYVGEDQEAVSFTINDIALAKTDPVLLPRYARVSSVDIMSLVGQEALALGFGTMNATINGESVFGFPLMLNKTLQVSSMLIIRCPKEDSNNLPKYVAYPVICTAGKCGQYPCTAGGDSGGPLLHESGIVGVLSRGPALDYEYVDHVRAPIGEYTPTSSVLDWIGDTVNWRKSNT